MTDEIRYGISDLADAAGVSVRTVRYYITEGLLPPPVTAGAKSYYTAEHRDRLIVIGRLKDGYLPLREIRRQLAEMDDEAIHEMAESSVMTEHHMMLEEEPSDYTHGPTGSAESNHFIHGREDIRSSPAPNRPQSSASEYINRVLKRAPDRRSPLPIPPPSSPAPKPSAPRDESGKSDGHATEASTWKRIPISEGAELLIREDLYQRRSDKVSWLVDWARKVLG